MTEAEAQAWLLNNFHVSRETQERLEVFEAFLKHEALSQNLISSSTLDHVWNRHIVDSAQLLTLLPQDVPTRKWLDLGSGAGFPGIVVAILSDFKMTLVESRARRINYLQRAVALLDLEAQVEIAGMAVERLETAPYSVISARAFAPLPRLFGLSARFSTDKTVWLLPKGRNAAREWREVQPVWNGDFRVMNSVTDIEAGILVGQLTGKRENSAILAAKRQHRR